LPFTYTEVRTNLACATWLHASANCS